MFNEPTLTLQEGIYRTNQHFACKQHIKGLCLESLLQEHGVIKAGDAQALQGLKEGDWVAVLPARSCLTVDAVGQFYVDGKGMVSTLRELVP